MVTTLKGDTMKCFTIKSGNDYVADVPRIITSSYYLGIKIQTVDDVDSAKHFKSIYPAKAWIKKAEVTITEKIKDYKARIKQCISTNNHNQWYVTSYRKTLKELKVLVEWIKIAQAIEIDVETPNFPCDLKLRFNNWRRQNADHASKMTLGKVSHSRYSCKACGVILKNIPFYELTEGNSTKICIACLYLRLDAIKTAFEGMPEDFRTGFINELVLGSL